MSRGRVPGGIRRLGRQPLRLGAVVLLAATALAAAATQHTASLVLQSTIEENWRGAYDILVTATDDLAEVDGALPPNALSGSSQGLGVEDWKRIRTIEGVGLAAPIGEILVPALSSGGAELVIPREVAKSGPEPQGYRMTVTYTTDDGLGERIVDRTEMPLVVDGREQPSASEEDIESCRNSVAGYGWGSTMLDIDRAAYPALVEDLCNHPMDRALKAGTPQDDGSWSMSLAEVGEDGVRFALPTAPQPITRITLVDPEAERELLGERGSFLDPLVSVQEADARDIDSLLAWAESGGGGEVSQRITDTLTRYLGLSFEKTSPEVLADIQRLLAANGLTMEQQIRGLLSGAGFTPLLVSDAEIAPLTMKVELEHIGAAPAEGDGYALPPAESGTPVGTSVGDMSGLLNPFTASAESLSWPGTTQLLAAEDDPWNSLTIRAVGKGDPSTYLLTPSGPALEPAGYANVLHTQTEASEALALDADPEQLGAEAAYTSPRPIWEVPETAGSTALPIGSFDPGDLGAMDAVNHVPLGAYAPVDSSVVGGVHAGATMRPGLSGLGLVSGRTVAIGSIASAAVWGDGKPISSIRVRVDGADGYTAEGRQRVLDVARAIEDAGYAATIVAGSSPRETALRVDGYAFGVDGPDERQRTGSLRAVAQNWSELGAASRVELATTTTAWTMLAIALAAGLLLLAAAQFALVPVRRAQAAVLREIGFVGPRIVRWFAAEEIPAVIVVVVIAGAAWLMSGFAPYAGIAAAVSVVVLLVSSALAVGAGALARPAPARDGRSRRLGARTVTGFGLRQALIHPVSSAVHVAAVVIVGFAAGALTETLSSGRALSGTSGLAVLVGAQLLLPQLVLGMVGVIGGLLLARLIRRLDLERRAEQWAVLRAAGWTAGQLARAQRAEGLALALPALVLTVAAVIGGGTLLGWSAGAAPALVGLAAGALSALLTFTTRRKGGAT